MKRRQLRRNAAACLVSLALTVAGATTGNAQTWHWKYVTRTPNVPPLTAESTVALEAGQLRMSYTVPIRHREVVIESCSAALTDVANAGTLHSQGRAFLLVSLKPSRSASCASGQRPAIVLPSDDEPLIADIAAAINRSCCSPAAVIARATPRPAASPAPSARPATATTVDWVETAGSFAFVRVKNTSSEPLRVRSVDVTSCRDVVLGCGPLAREFLISPKSIVTILSVTSADERRTPIFHYSYIAAQGGGVASHSGSSRSPASIGIPRMSAREIAKSEATTVGGVQPPHVEPAEGAFTPARLLKRGSSRLAIGETGSAVVRLVIAADGTPQAATIVSMTNQRLAAAAIETAVSSTFAPATQNGNPVSAKYVATFSFDGEDPALSAIPVWKRSPAPAPNALPTSASGSDSGPAASTSAPQPAPQPLTSATPQALISAVLPSSPTSPPTPETAPSAVPLPAASPAPQTLR
jgi:hypothetical protein